MPAIIKSSFYAQIKKNRVISYQTKWDYNYFVRPSSVFSMDIARVSIALSAAAYGTEESACDRTHRSIHDTMYAIGLREFRSAYFEPKSGAAGCFAGRARTDIGGTETEMVVFAIRGTTGSEWFSNLNIADSDHNNSGDHEGFRSCADKVTAFIRQYLAEVVFSAGRPVKILITGHSRGGAVANLVAHDLTAGAAKIEKDNLYAYTFAASAVTRSPAASVPVYNIIGTEDCILLLPLTLWGYHRHGRDCFLPSKASCTARLEVIGQSIFDFENYLYTLTPDKLTYPWYPNGYGDILRYQTGIYDIAENIPTGYEWSEDGLQLRDFLNCLADFRVNGRWRRLCSYFWSPRYRPLVWFLAANHSRIRCSHAVEAYVSWMETMKEADLMSQCAEPDAAWAGYNKYDPELAGQGGK